MSRFGARLATIGDVNGDGIADLAVSDPHAKYAGGERGSVWVVMLARSGDALAMNRITDRIDDLEKGTLNGVGFARSLAAPGDLDGDGVPELVVGCWKGLWILYLEREGTVRDAREVRLCLKEWSWFGRSISCTSAFPGDRVPMVVGGRVAGSYAGAVWLMTLGPDGAIEPWL